MGSTPQLILVTNGSGARGYSRGTSVYGVNVFTGRRDGRWERPYRWGHALVVLV